MLPTPDSRWAVLFQIESYEQYMNHVAERIYLKPVVDDDVKGIFKLVQRLIDLAYFEYELFDIACMKALLAFELALKKQYEIVKDASSPHIRDLQGYIKWFCQNGYFETENEEAVQQIRQIRNEFAHPKYHSFAGPMASWPIHAAAQLVNDLYEDRDLRKLRRTEQAALELHLGSLLKEGMILSVKERIPIYIYDFTTTLINNKHANKTYHFAYKPIFEINTEYKKGEGFNVYGADELACTSVALTSSNFSGFDEKGELIFQLSPPVGDQKAHLDKWFSSYRDFLQKAPHYPMIDGRSISESAAARLWEFHKLQQLF